MKIFVLDEELKHKSDIQRGTARHWHQILGPDTVLLSSADEHEFRTLDSGELVSLSEGVVVTHRPSPDHLDALAGATSSGQIYILLVSGSPAQGPWEFDSETFYRVKQPLKNPDDPGFTRRFHLFLANLEAASFRRAEFSLLEPEMLPEALLAYALAVHYHVGAKFLSALRSESGTSYDKLQPYVRTLVRPGSVLSFPDIGIPCSTQFSIEGKEEASLRFKSVRNMIDLLREDL